MLLVGLLATLVLLTAQEARSAREPQKKKKKKKKKKKRRVWAVRVYYFLARRWESSHGPVFGE